MNLNQEKPYFLVIVPLSVRLEDLFNKLTHSFLCIFYKGPSTRRLFTRTWEYTFLQALLSLRNVPVSKQNSDPGLIMS